MLTDEQAGRLLGNTVRHKLAGGTNVYTLDLSAYKPLRPAFWRAFFETVANDLAVWAALSWQNADQHDINILWRIAEQVYVHSNRDV